MDSDTQEPGVRSDWRRTEAGLELLLDEPDPAAAHLPAAPHVIVLSGATGDLAKRKLLPELFHLSRAGMLPERHIGAPSLELLADDYYRGIARRACDEYARGGVSDHHWGDFQDRLVYVPGEAGATGLAETVHRLEATFATAPRRLHCLSIPPSAADAVVCTLGERWVAVPVVLRVFDRDLARMMERNFGFRHVRSTWALAAPSFVGAALGLDVLKTFFVDQQPFLVGRLATTRAGACRAWSCRTCRPGPGWWR